MLTPDQKTTKRMVKEETEPLREEIERLKIEIGSLRSAVNTLARGFQPLR